MILNTQVNQNQKNQDALADITGTNGNRRIVRSFENLSNTAKLDKFKKSNLV